MSTSITRRAALTGTAAGAAALATGTTTATAVKGRDWQAAIDRLPETMRMMAYLEVWKDEPVEARRELVAKMRSRLSSDDPNSIAFCDAVERELLGAQS